MKKLFTAVVLAVLTALVLSACGAATSPAPSRLPDATLEPLRDTGTAVNLRDLRGPTVVNRWANWCQPCRRELPIYQQFHRKHPDVQLLGVDSLDPARDKALAVADKAGVTYPLVVDRDRVIPGQGLPELILLDKAGHIAWRGFLEIKSLTQLEALVRRHLGVDL